MQKQKNDIEQLKIETRCRNCLQEQMSQNIIHKYIQKASMTQNILLNIGHVLLKQGSNIMLSIFYIYIGPFDTPFIMFQGLMTMLVCLASKYFLPFSFMHWLKLFDVLPTFSIVHQGLQFLFLINGLNHDRLPCSFFSYLALVPYLLK